MMGTMYKITDEMIEAAMPDLAHLPPMSDGQLFKAAQILRESLKR